MSIAKRPVVIALAGLASLAIPAAAFAQAGGADVPDQAKTQGEKEQPGSTGKSNAGGAMKKDGGSMEKSGSMEKGGDKK